MPPGPSAPDGAFGGTLLFTSGTTGRPKGCLRTPEAEAARARELMATYRLSRDDVHLIVCPLAHSAPGIFLRAARAAGARTILLPRFDARGFLADVARFRASVFFLVPTQVERLLALPDAERAAADLSSVRAWIVAGAPFAPASKRRLLEWLGPGKLWEFYGSTETGTVTVLPPEAQPGPPACVGWPQPGTDLRVVDPTGAHEDVTPGEVGEIYVRGPAVMTAYLEGDQQTRLGDHLSVGDLGRVLPDGALVLVDRKHDLIITGGVNVYPADVERALCEHPDVAGAVVTGVPDPDWGERVVALVAPRPDAAAPPTAATLLAFLHARIAAYKIPKQLVVVASADDLPTSRSMCCRTTVAPAPSRDWRPSQRRRREPRQQHHLHPEPELHRPRSLRIHRHLRRWRAATGRRRDRRSTPHCAQCARCPTILACACSVAALGTLGLAVVVAGCGPSGKAAPKPTPAPKPASDPAACKAGDGAACVRVAEAHAAQGDEAGAINIYKRACTAGAEAGCTRFEELVGAKCDGGDLPACNSLGFFHDQRGAGAKAAPLYKKVCDGGAMPGCVNLGYLYENGQGVAVDLDQARDLYKKACDGADMDGCGNLAALYFNGLGVKQDHKAAAVLLTKACDGEHAQSCSVLADLTEGGVGVAKDAALASKLRQRACTLGFQDACQ